jgi:hypothetical protein
MANVAMNVLALASHFAMALLKWLLKSRSGKM